jgi:hypothetical protein
MAENTPQRHGAGTYQMLWDCKFCGTQKLLGVTHRHCPNCGAAQDPAARYFPREEEMVAVENHQYVGADKICPACRQPNSAASTYCSECGADLATGQVAPMQATRDVGTGIAEGDTRRDLVQEQFVAQMDAIKADKARQPAFLGLRRKEWIIAVGVILAALCVVGAVYALTYRKSAAGVVTALSWERTIEIEDFQPRAGADWDESVPGDAYSLSCEQRQRSTRKVPDGSHEECKDVDQGDGSFKRECRTVTDYREEPVYDRWCSYRVDRWAYKRSVKASGNGQNPAPTWPTPTLSSAAAGRYGQEREGQRKEKYTVAFREKDGKKHQCDFDSLSRWMSFGIEKSITVKLYITGGADCDSLKPAS